MSGKNGVCLKAEAACKEPGSAGAKSGQLTALYTTETCSAGVRVDAAFLQLGGMGELQLHKLHADVQ